MKETYICVLNGRFYGSGNIQYMKELFNDYVVLHRMYGQNEVNFKILKNTPENRQKVKDEMRKLKEIE